jgi:hypothetical protein
VKLANDQETAMSKETAFLAAYPALASLFNAADHRLATPSPDQNG